MMSAKSQPQLSLLKSMYQLARPFGLKKMGALIVLVVLQSLLQIFALVALSLFLEGILQPEQLNEGKVADILHSLGMQDITGFKAAMMCLTSQLAIGASGLFFEWRRYQVSSQFNSWLKQRLFSIFYHQSYSFYLRQQPSFLTKLITQDAQVTSQTVFSVGLDVINRGLISLSLIIMLFLMNPWVCLQLGGVIGISYIVIWKVLKGKRQRIVNNIKQGNRGLNQIALQFISGIKLISTYGKKNIFASKFNQSNQQLAQASALSTYFGVIPRYIMEPVAIIGIVGAYLILTGLQGHDNSYAMTLLGAMGYAALRLLIQMQGVYQGMNAIAGSRAYLDEIVQFIDKEGANKESLAKDANQPDTINPTETNLEFNQLTLANVSFAYDNQSKTALTNINFMVNKGDRIGVIGKTGSGKSTLIDLMLGLIQPINGEVKINGDHLHHQQGLLQAWQTKVGYVPQDTFLLDESIAKNIALELDDSKIDRDQIKQVCNMAQIDDWIESDLEAQYDTLVGERGVRLSGGQRQRIAIARALYRKPEVLILDEATSALDNQTETELMNMVYKLDKNITIIMVAHRLSTVSQVDRMIELKSGMVQ